MPRKPVISRTMKIFDCLVLCADTESEAIVQRHYLVTDKHKTDNDIIKAIEKNYKPYENHLKPLYVKSKIPKITLRGLTEDEFLMLSRELPPRSKQI